MNERLERLLDDLGTPEQLRPAIRDTHTFERARALHPSNPEPTDPDLSVSDSQLDAWDYIWPDESDGSTAA